MPTTPDAQKSRDHAATNSPDGLTPPDDLIHREQEDHIHRRKDELLDLGVEETFPASDPVAVKHIT